MLGLCPGGDAWLSPNLFFSKCPTLKFCLGVCTSRLWTSRRQNVILFIHSFFLAIPLACGSSWARDRTPATVTTQATAMTCWILNLLCCKRTLIYLFIYLPTLGLHPWHMEVPRLGVELELQLPDCATATATLDPSHIRSLCRNSWQRWILTPLSRARNQACFLTDTSPVRYHWATVGTPSLFFIEEYLTKIISI